MGAASTKERSRQQAEESKQFTDSTKERRSKSNTGICIRGREGTDGGIGRRIFNASKERREEGGIAVQRGADVQVCATHDGAGTWVVGEGTLQGGEMLKAILNGSAHVKTKGMEIVVERDNECIRAGELSSMLRVAKIEDQELLKSFFSNPSMSLEGLAKESDRMDIATPELSRGLYKGTNVLQHVTEEELEAVAHYTTVLYKGMNSLLRGDLRVYLDGSDDWLMPGKNARDETTLNVIVAHAIVVSSTLNKLPNFTSKHNGSLSNPEGYMSRGLKECPEHLMKQLKKCAASKGKLLFFDSAFISTCWNTVPTDFSPVRGRGVLLKVESKTGSHVFHASAHAIEREVLFVPGTKFRVSKGKRDKATGAPVFILIEEEREF